MKSNYITHRSYYIIFSISAVLLLFTGIPETRALQSDSLSAVLTGLVKNADGNTNQHEPPTVTFTAHLNQSRDSILIENAPRWDGGENNISGNGSYRLQIGNFKHLSVGDSVHLRFKDRTLDQQGAIHKKIDELPWDSNPLGSPINLEERSFPAAPQNVELTISDSNERIVSWTAKSGLTYDVYRRTLQDTLNDGQSRNLYIRVAEGLTSGTFTDQTTTDTVNFAYMIYAENDQGVYSPHSQEGLQLQQVQNLRVEATTATNVQLQWDDYDPAVGQLGGYQVYRRTENGSYGNPVAYTNREPSYRDTRLNPGKTYYYKVEARDQRQNMFGRSSEVQAVTKSSSDGYYTYANVKMAAVIYTNVGGDKLSDAKVQEIKSEYELAREFYWRNSEMKFNVEIDYYVIEDRQNFSEVSVSNVAQRLKERGVYNTQYDMVFTAWPINSGYWSIGTGASLDLPGPERNTGFAQTQVPCGTGVVWPGEPDKDYCFTWIFIHENQHTIDALYNTNGHPSMAHGDLPQIFNEPAGSHLDFQARMFRVFEPYLGLNRNWGDIIQVKDQDGDGMPDNDPRVPVDEQAFGSDPTLADSDGDGLDDRGEMLSGIYNGSDPNQSHSDSDSLADGPDPYPRYNVETYIKRLPDTMAINVDGKLDDWAGLDSRVSTGVSYVENNDTYRPKVEMVWTEQYLYIGMRLEDIGIPKFRFEFEGDGRWHGAGNTRMSVNISEGTFSEFRSWDARKEVREFSDGNPDDNHPGAGMWDSNSDYQEEFRRKVFYKQSVKLGTKLDFPKFTLEMAIPRNEPAGHYLRAGDSLGWNINYGKVNNKTGNWATTFDQYRFVYFDLIDQMATSASGDPQIARTLKLKQNYPNPFNPTTRIQFALPQTQKVSLKVYDILGREVATLVNATREAGRHSVKFDAGNLSSGMYIYRLQAGSRSRTKKMMLMK